MNIEQLQTFVEVADAGLGIAYLPDALAPVLTRLPARKLRMLANGGIAGRAGPFADLRPHSGQEGYDVDVRVDAVGGTSRFQRRKHPGASGQE